MPALEGFREAELNIGLNYLISPGFGEQITRPRTAMRLRRRAATVTVSSLIGHCFTGGAPRCSPRLRIVIEPGRCG